MRIRLLVFALPVIATIVLASVAYGDPAATDMARAEAAGWDCAPAVPIAGQYQHCSQPGKPSVVDLLSSDGITAPSVQLRVYNFADKSASAYELPVPELLATPAVPALRYNPNDTQMDSCVPRDSNGYGAAYWPVIARVVDKR